MDDPLIFQAAVNESLDAAIDNGYDLTAWDAEAIAEDLGSYDAKFDMTPVQQLVPYVQVWLTARDRKRITAFLETIIDNTSEYDDIRVAEFEGSGIFAVGIRYVGPGHEDDEVSMNRLLNLGRQMPGGPDGYCLGLEAVIPELKPTLWIGIRRP